MFKLLAFELVQSEQLTSSPTWPCAVYREMHIQFSYHVSTRDFNMQMANCMTMCAVHQVSVCVCVCAYHYYNKTEGMHDMKR